MNYNVPSHFVAPRIFRSICNSSFSVSDSAFAAHAFNYRLENARNALRHVTFFLHVLH